MCQGAIQNLLANRLRARLPVSQEARALLRKTLPVARRVTRDSSELSIRMRTAYALALYTDTAATLDDLREAVTTLEDAARIARPVFGGTHPIVVGIERDMKEAQVTLRARETP